ncbi:hypothetical protein OROMI_031139 [Orobanche minor]
MMFEEIKSLSDYLKGFDPKVTPGIIIMFCLGLFSLYRWLLAVFKHRASDDVKVYFASDEVVACIVTCGGLCSGLNTVIREIVHSLDCMYGVNEVLDINVYVYLSTILVEEHAIGVFYSKNMIPLTPKVVNDIHKRGGTILGTSQCGHDTMKIVDSIEDHGINQVYIIGGDGTRKGAAVIYEKSVSGGLKVAVAGIPKTIDNDILVIDKSFGFDTAVEEAQRAIKAAHVEELLTAKGEKDASGNKLLQDVGLWLSEKIKDHFSKTLKHSITLKYIDPTCMIRAIPSNASDNIYCTLLAQSAVHGAMAGYTGFTCGLVNGSHTYIPFNRITENQNKVVITDRESTELPWSERD